MKSFVKGNHYVHADFCNENLNDYGYGASTDRSYRLPAGYTYEYGAFPYSYRPYYAGLPFPWWYWQQQL